MKTTITFTASDVTDLIERDAYARGFNAGRWASSCLFYFGIAVGVVLGGAVVLLLHAYGR